MATGTVKWFNPTKGYGFIQPSGGAGKDVFVHISAVERAGLNSLNQGQTVEYEIDRNRGKESAVNLKIRCLALGKSIVEEAPEYGRSTRMLQLPQGSGLDLPNSLACERELLADFLQRVVGVHADAKAHAYDALLARRQ